MMINLTKLSPFHEYVLHILGFYINCNEDLLFLLTSLPVAKPIQTGEQITF